MGTLNLVPYKPVAGTTSDASAIDSAFDAIQTVINGHIDDANVDATSNVAMQKGKPLGLTGATQAARFVGATTTGAPVSGTFLLGDFIVDQSGKMWVCTVAGSPGTWVQVGASGGVTNYRKTTAKVVNTSTATTDLLNGEIAVGAGVMGATGVLRLTASGDYKQNSGGTTNAFRFQLVLGATTIFDTGAPAFALSNLATRLDWKVNALISNTATNAQVCHFELRGSVMSGTGSAPVAFTTGEGNYWLGIFTNGGSILASAYNAAAVDTTSSQALALNVINPSASANCETVLKSALIEVI